MNSISNIAVWLMHFLFVGIICAMLFQKPTKKTPNRSDALNTLNTRSRQPYPDTPRIQLLKSISIGQMIEGNDEKEFDNLMYALEIVDVNERNNAEHGYTALHYIALAGALPNKQNLAFASVLISRGADLNARDDRQNTPLHIAAANYRALEVLDLFIQRGANLNALNADNQLALEIILKRSLGTIVSSLNLGNFPYDPIMRLINFISWYIYSKLTNAIEISAENDANLRDYLKGSYQSHSALQTANPLLSWMVSEMLDCHSKKQWIEKILKYLEVVENENDHQKRKDILFTHTDGLFLLTEDILEEFGLNFNTFKGNFELSVLEELAHLLRYKYAQKLKEKIFANFKDSTNNLIEHCKSTKIKSPFVNKFLLDNQISTNDILQLTNDAHIHLKYIIEKNGTALNSPTRFGETEGQDILLFGDEEN